MVKRVRRPTIQIFESESIASRGRCHFPLGRPVEAKIIYIFNVLLLSTYLFASSEELLSTFSSLQKMLLSSPNSIESTTTNYRNAIITFCQHVVQANFKAKNWLTFDCHYTAPSAHILAAHEVTVCLFVCLFVVIFECCKKCESKMSFFFFGRWLESH
jgi:hypothetical protein